MKKRLVLLTVCLVTTAAVVFTQASYLKKAGTKITVTGTTLKGDEQTVTGQKMTVTALLNDNVEWDTSFTAGEEENAKTKLTSRVTELPYMDAPDPAGMFVDFDSYSSVHADFAMSREYNLREDNSEGQIPKAIRKMMSDYQGQLSDEGDGIFQVQIPLKDYYTEISPFIDITTDYVSDCGGAEELDGNLKEYEKSGLMQKSIAELAAKFAVPVGETEASMTIIMDEQGSPSTVSLSLELDPFSAEGADNTLKLVGDTSADYVYLILTSCPAQDRDVQPVSGQLQDYLNSILDGSGIYRVPIIFGRPGEECLDVDAIELYYPIDPCEQILDLRVSADDSNAYLLVNDASGCSEWNIDLTNREKVQEFSVNGENGAISFSGGEVNRSVFEKCTFLNSEEDRNEFLEKYSDQEETTVIPLDQADDGSYSYLLSEMNADPENPHMLIYSLNPAGTAVFLVGEDGMLTKAAIVNDPDLLGFISNDYDGQIICKWDSEHETFCAARFSSWCNGDLSDLKFYLAALCGDQLGYLGIYELNLKTGCNYFEGDNSLTSDGLFTLGSSVYNIPFVKFE